MGFPGVIWRGEVYYVDLGQPVGHEPAFRRPAVVVSVDILNNGPGGLVMVVPITSTSYGLRSHVELGPSGLDNTSFARWDHPRLVSTQRLSTRIGMLSPQDVAAVDQALRFVLDL